MEVAPGVHRLGTSLVNWYLLEEGGRLTLVDAGMPKQWRQLAEEVARLGRSLDDVEAIVLTHAHVDHVGFAERARTELGASVHAHADDVEITAGAESRARKFPPLHLYWRPTSWPFLAQGLREGLLSTPPVVELRTFEDGELLDLPGKPRVVHTPGHTAGSCVLHLGDAEAVLTGDALVTLDPYTQRRGPRLMIDGVNEDSEEALASLERLRGLSASVVLPGHGEPWRGGLDAAVDEAALLGVTS